jgi:hypothetical protein
MKTTARMVMAAVMGTTAWAGEIPPAAERKVTVCMEIVQDRLTVYRAQALAAKMFTAIGVAIRWRHPGHTCPVEAIVIDQATDTPKDYLSGALGYALPYEGTHIRIFYDRLIQFVTRERAPPILAHIMVHEIAHILQGTDRHSRGGVMKARWDREDYWRMPGNPLEFTEYDVLLIHLGIDQRAARRLPPAQPEDETVGAAAVH